MRFQAFSLVVLAIVLSLGCTRKVDNSGGDDFSFGSQDSTGGKDTAGGNDAQGLDTAGEDNTYYFDSTGGQDGTGGMTVEAIQKDEMGMVCGDVDFVNLYTGIQVTDLIVGSEVYTVSKTSGLRGFFALQDGGGAYKGILVTVDAELTFDGVAIGDVIDVQGDVTEAFCNTQLSLKAMTKTGTDTVPAPVAIDAADLADAATAEQWEGVYVQISGADVATVNATYGSFTLSDGLAVQGTLFGFALPKVGCKYTSIAGFVNYSYGKFVLMPTKEADLVLDGSVSCETTETVNSVYDLQSSTESNTCADPNPQFVNLDPVAFTGLVISTPGIVKTGDKLLFHAQMPEGGAYSGITLLMKTSLGSALVPGDIVDVEGSWLEYYCLSEIQVSAITETGVSGSALVPAVIDGGIFVSTSEGYPTEAEKYESVLVKVSNQKVASLDTFGGTVLETGLIIDNKLSGDLGLAVGDTVSSVTGVLSYSFNAYRVYPLNTADVVK